MWRDGKLASFLMCFLIKHKMHCEELVNVNFLLRTVLLFESIFELKNVSYKLEKVLFV